MSEPIYLHFHYDYENSKEWLCRDAKCYKKRQEDKRKLEQYQELVDRDLMRKENLQMIEESLQDPRIDGYR